MGMANRTALLVFFMAVFSLSFLWVQTAVVTGSAMALRIPADSRRVAQFDEAAVIAGARIASIDCP